MNDSNIFERYELKYLITKEQKEIILSCMEPYMKEDPYGRSTIRNVYFDLPDFLLIRRSFAKPVYKEKLRIRSYNAVSSAEPIFVELKKKYKSVVYKRRISLPERDAMRYLCQGAPLDTKSQISREIDYFLEFYKALSPTVFLSYDREAFYAAEDGDFRVTFDDNILWRNYDLSLTKSIYGFPLISSDLSLMEIKTGSAIPLWMVSILTSHQIYKTSFSKYGTAFQQILSGTVKQKGGELYA